MGKTINPKDKVWTEKYRPVKLDDMVGDFKDKIRSYLKDSNSMQHLLLYSVTPGTGKTTLSKVIINELGSDALTLNASDDRKIETIREKVVEFVRTKSSVQNKRRIVFMDEADGLTNIAQDALRNLMETYAENALFILTCNSLNKINAAIQSRCVKIFFGTPDRIEILEFLKKICEAENLEYNDEGLVEVINLNYPSIRNCVQALQEHHISNKSITKETAKKSEDLFESLWNKVTVEKDWKYVKDYIFNNEVNIRALNKYFWYNAVEKSNIKLIQITASNEDKFTRGGEELVIFVTSLVDMSR